MLTDFWDVCWLLICATNPESTILRGLVSLHFFFVERCSFVHHKTFFTAVVSRSEFFSLGEKFGVHNESTEGISNKNSSPMLWLCLEFMNNPNRI